MSKQILLPMFLLMFAAIFGFFTAVNAATCNSVKANAGTDVTVREGDTVRFDGSVTGDYDTLSWGCTGGTLSDSTILRPTYRAPYDGNNLTYNCTLTARNECSSDSDSLKVTVENSSNNNLRAALIARPKSDCAPLDNVDLTATVYDYTAYNSDFTYYFDCENDGDWDKTVTDNKDSYTAIGLCDYQNIGSYTAKVKVEYRGQTATDTEIVRAESCGGTTGGSVVITKTVKNVTTGSQYQGKVSASPLHTVAYRITIEGKNGNSGGVTVTDEIPSGITNIRELKVDGAAYSGNIASGINLGTVSAGQTKTIAYTGTVANETNFTVGQTTLNNTATVKVGDRSADSNAAVVVTRPTIAGPTTIPTGFDSNTLAGLALALMAAIAALLWVGKDLIADAFQKTNEK